MKIKLLDITTISSIERNYIYNQTHEILQMLGLSEKTAEISTSIALFILAIVLLLIIDFVTKHALIGVFTKIIVKTKTTIDDFLLKNKVLDKLAHLFPVLAAKAILPIALVGLPTWLEVTSTLIDISIVLVILSIFNAVLKTIIDILRRNKAFIDKPLDSYLQVIQIFMMFFAGTIIFSILTGKSPISFLVSLGAASAILMLVFKDTILGFVASIQVSANDSVRVGDWIEMPKYDADGTVLKITLNNVKIQNFDKTIVSIPTHTLLSDSFKNYRGMYESGGRRIKRSINIKISSIRYLSEEEIEALRSIQILTEYIDERQAEIDSYNLEHKIDRTNPVNGRRMTNIGMFREYITRHAKRNPNINKDLTLMVRQLPPSEKGLPLELYMFASSTVWSEYENIMSSIFDHLFSAIKYFHLEVFELPASDDLRHIIDNNKTD